MDRALVVATPDLELGIWFYAVGVFWLIILVALVLGWLRLIYAMWVYRTRSAERSCEPPAPVERRDDFYGHGARHSSGSSASGADEFPDERNG